MNFQTWSQVAFAFAVTPQLLAQAILLSATLGLVGGLFPAIRAARLPDRGWLCGKANALLGVRRAATLWRGVFGRVIAATTVRKLRYRAALQICRQFTGSSRPNPDETCRSFLLSSRHFICSAALPEGRVCQQSIRKTQASGKTPSSLLFEDVETADIADIANAGVR
jgi:hypothetical protein